MTNCQKREENLVMLQLLMLLFYNCRWNFALILKHLVVQKLNQVSSTQIYVFIDHYILKYLFYQQKKYFQNVVLTNPLTLLSCSFLFLEHIIFLPLHFHVEKCLESSNHTTNVQHSTFGILIYSFQDKVFDKQRDDFWLYKSYLETSDQTWGLQWLCAYIFRYQIQTHLAQSEERTHKVQRKRLTD